MVNILTEKRKDICLLETIEPAFFDKHRNIMELIIGTMFGKYEDWLDEQQDANRHNLLVELGYAFQEVKRDLQYIESECCQEDSELEDLQGLASSIGFPCALLPFSVKSINNSPNAVTSKALFPILYPPCCDGKKHSIRNKILSIVNNINLAQEREFVKQFSLFFCAKMLK